MTRRDFVRNIREDLDIALLAIVANLSRKVQDNRNLRHTAATCAIKMEGSPRVSGGQLS